MKIEKTFFILLENHFYLHPFLNHQCLCPFLWNQEVLALHRETQHGCFTRP